MTLSVDTEAAEKAGHDDEFCREIQAALTTAGVASSSEVAMARAEDLIPLLRAIIVFQMVAAIV